ncbi:MAG: zinc ribbon domain-containing protein [Thaumarchaeota archaeon]|nr:zinc ribbon domain-containing protein [Nitrososphaerota archaeon]
MIPEAASSTTPSYDEQLGTTFTQSFTSIDYNVTAIQQQDSSSGLGPAYLLNGLTGQGYWYQVGLTYNWGGNVSGSGYVAGFNMAYEVFNSRGNSVFPSTGQGGLTSYSGTVNPGDTVVLNLYFSGGDVVMLSKDLNTSAEASVTYNAEGSTSFVGLSSTSNSNGFFTGLMTEWYHVAPYYGNERGVLYSDKTAEIASAVMWMDEFNTQTRGALFDGNSGVVSYPNPDQLQEFSLNGTTEYSNAYEYISGAVVTKVSLALSYSVQGGGTGYSPPILTYIANGVTKTAPLSTSPTTFEVDSGSTWSVSPTLTGSSASERWQTDQPTSEASSSALIVNVVYYNQYLQTISYSTSDSSNPPPPTFATDQFGSPVNETLSTSPASYWFDGGASWSVTNPLAGEGGERWMINASLQADGGVLSSSQTTDFAYAHQFLATFTASPSGEGLTTPTGPNLWENSGTLSVSATSSPGYFFSSWSSSTDAITFAAPQSASTTVTISGTGTVTANFVVQVSVSEQVSITMSPKGSSPVTVTISGCNADIASIPADGNPHAFTASSLCALTFTAPARSSSMMWEFSNSGAGSVSWTYTTGNNSADVKANTLYALDRAAVKYSVSGGGSGYSAPVLSFQELGLPQTYSMTTTGTEVDIDQGSSWTVTNPLSGSGSGERWQATGSAISGTSADGTTIHPIYLHQFLLTVNGAGLSSQWYNSSARATLSIPGISDRASGSGERVASYSIDGTSTEVVPTAGTITVTIVMNSPHTLSISSVQQYQVSVDASAASAISSITPPTISGDDYWYDQGTQVSLVLNGVWNRSAGAGERLISFSVNGASKNVSTTDSVDVLSLSALSAPQAVSGMITAQYSLTTTTGSVASVTAPSISGDEGWYDSGTQVSLTYYYSWNNLSGDSRHNALSYAVGGSESALKRSGDGTFPVQLSITAPETVTIASTTQYLLTISGGHDVFLSSASPTGDAFYDAGATVTATTDYTWGLVGGDIRQSLVSYTLDSSVTNVTAGSPGNFTTPAIAFSGPHTLVFNSVIQDLVAFQFKDSTGANTIIPTSVQIQLEDPTIISVPLTGVWLDSGTKFQIYDVEWEGTDVKPANQNVYTVDLPSNQTVLDRVYSGNIVATDYLGLPVADARASVTLANGTTIFSVTGSNGSVALPEIPLGNFTAKVAYLGATTSVKGNTAIDSTTQAKMLASYPTFGLIFVLLAVIAAASLIVVRRGHRSQEVPPSIEQEVPPSIGQAHEPVCKYCGSATEPGSPYCPNCGRTQT